MVRPSAPDRVTKNVKNDAKIAARMACWRLGPWVPMFVVFLWLSGCAHYLRSVIVVGITYYLTDKYLTDICIPTMYYYLTDKSTVYESVVSYQWRYQWELHGSRPCHSSCKVPNYQMQDIDKFTWIKVKLTGWFSCSFLSSCLLLNLDLRRQEA